jgi:hypothetical protein
MPSILRDSTGHGAQAVAIEADVYRMRCNSRLRPILRLSLAVIAALATVAAGTVEAAPARVAGVSAVAQELRARGAALFGVSTTLPTDGAVAGVPGVARIAGKAPALVNVYRSFADAFDAALIRHIAASGALPMVTWEPWRAGGGVRQRDFALRRIAAGAHDAYVREWARTARFYGRPLLLRFAPEMNGDWTPWSAGSNGNTSADYVRAWRHVHDVFRRAGAWNVSWVWSPNVVFRGSAPLARLYPGDAYVDWIGIDGYNWGTSRPGHRWLRFDQLFGPTLGQVRRLAHKPLMLSEVASSERGGDKAAWIDDFFRALLRNRDVLAFVWFDFDKETDWRIASSVAARSAFVRGVSAARYRGAASVGA